MWEFFINLLLRMAGIPTGGDFEWQKTMSSSATVIMPDGEQLFVLRKHGYTWTERPVSQAELNYIHRQMDFARFSDPPDGK